MEAAPWLGSRPHRWKSVWLFHFRCRKIPCPLFRRLLWNENLQAGDVADQRVQWIKRPFRILREILCKNGMNNGDCIEEDNFYPWVALDDVNVNEYLTHLLTNIWPTFANEYLSHLLMNTWATYHTSAHEYLSHLLTNTRATWSLDSRSFLLLPWSYHTRVWATVRIDPKRSVKQWGEWR